MGELMLETLILLGAIVGCLAVVAAPLPPAETIDPQGPGSVARRRGELALALATLLGSAAALLSLLAVSYGHLRLLVPIVAVAMTVALVAYPWILVRLAIRLGAWRTALSLGRRAHPWLRDPNGGAVLAATLSLLRRSDSAPEQRNLLRRRLGIAPLRGAGVVSLGLLEAMAGRPDSARRLLESIELLDPCDSPPLAQSIALDWRVADAATRGAWGEIVRMSGIVVRPSRTVRFITACARRLTGEAVSDRELRRAWMKAPRRLQTFSLLRRALAHAPSERVDDSLPELAANDGGELERQAVALHVEAMTVAAEGIIEPPHLERLGTAWDRCLDDWDFRRRIRARAEALDTALPADRLLGKLRADVEQDMCDILPPDPIEGAKGTLARAVELSQLRGYRRLHTAIIRLRALRAPERVCTSWDVWSAWSQAVSGYQDACRACRLEARREVFAEVEPDLAATAGWLSHHAERPTASAISLWVVQEADRVRDLPAAAHHRAWLVLG
jgi:hypothetical protein